MYDENLSHLLDVLNDETGKDWIFHRPLLVNVSIARVWNQLPDGRSVYYSGDRFYFVRDERDRFIAAIFDMGPNDLHVFVREAYRRQGVMSRALHEVVLPHMFLNGRKTQEATFISVASRGMLEKVGFTIVGPDKAVITKDQVQHVDFPEMGYVPFTEERMEALKKRVWLAAGLLRMVDVEIDTYSGPDIHHQLEGLVEELEELGTYIEDEWWHLHGGVSPLISEDGKSR